MARCKSIETVRQIISAPALEIVDVSDSDSNDDVSDPSDEEITNTESGKDFQSSDSSEDVNDETVNNGPILSLECLHEDISHKQQNLESIKIVAVNGSSEVIVPLIPEQQSSISTRSNWTGAHNFRIKIHCGDSFKKSESAIFSESLNKLYVSKDLPFKVLVYAENVPTDSVIRVTPAFASPELAYEKVQRCPTHAQQDYVKGNAAFQHLVQSYSDIAFYQERNGICSVAVPYEPPREGETYSTYLFQLTCFSSCSGGINRRPIMLVFTLEKDNIPRGRHAIDTKVCACPLRDFRADEERELKRNKEIDETIINKDSKSPASGCSDKPLQVTSNTSDIQYETSSSPNQEKTSSKYIITTRDPELYYFLKQMKSFYEASAFASSLKSDT